MKKNPLPKPVNGLSVVYSAVNQAYFIVLQGVVLRVINDRDDAIYHFNEFVAIRDGVQAGK